MNQVLVAHEFSPDCIPANICIGKTIDWVAGSLVGWWPILPSGNGFISKIWEQILDRTSPGPQNYIWLLAMYDDGINVYWFHAWQKVQNSWYYNGYIKCIKVNKTTWVVTIINSWNTMYVLSSGWSPWNGTPDKINQNWTSIGFLFAPHSHDFSCNIGSFRSWLITFDTSTDSRGTYTYHQDVATCWGYWPYLRWDLVFPWTALIWWATYATIMWISMTVLWREITGSGYSLYDEIYFSL